MILDYCAPWDEDLEQADVLAGLCEAELDLGPIPVPAHMVNWNKGQAMRWPQRPSTRLYDLTHEKRTDDENR